MPFARHCPFCGGRNLKMDDLTLDESEPCFTTVCSDCTAWGPVAKSMVDAVAKWNVRPTDKLFLAATRPYVQAYSLNTGGH